MNEKIYKKLEEFAALPQGWNYGEGESISYETVDRVKRIVEAMVLTEDNFEIFPLLDGGIQINIYINSGSIVLEVYPNNVNFGFEAD